MDKRKNKVIDIHIGESFNKLTIQRFVHFTYTPSGRKVPIVWAICECGKGKAISLWDIVSGKTKTCGFDHPHYLDRTAPAFHRLYQRYEHVAKKTGKAFEISQDEFKRITKEPCHYCGIQPKKQSIANNHTKYNTGRAISIYEYNGLDRIDSSKGYMLDNVLPCCSICNHAKHTMSYDDFIEWLDRIAKFRSKDNLIFVNGGVNV